MKYFACNWASFKPGITYPGTRIIWQHQEQLELPDVSGPPKSFDISFAPN